MERRQGRQTRSSRSTTTTMKTTFCIPRYKPASRKNTRLSPMTLLDRFREAVFRLIMISAISKAAAATGASSSGSSTPHRESRASSSSSTNSPGTTASSGHRGSYYYYYRSNDYHNEAVADCIEFIKKSAVNDHGETSDSIDSTAEVNVVLPLPV